MTFNSTVHAMSGSMAALALLNDPSEKP
uniref:Uncharacterized protein n=1 Tax=Physcomitrium patens TaxID=3218 RepID=A0A7I4BSB7_PHYPA